MSSTTCYDAVPLDTERQSIRLVRLINGDSKDGLTRIKCELQHFSLSSAPAYTALSYTWGRPEPTKPVMINSTEFLVRENLWDFLNEQQSSGEEEWYWIDALCIDQSSIEERNHQVSMMREIYSKAAVVKVWLGRSTSDSDMAMEWLSKLGRLGDSALKEHPDSPEQERAVWLLWGKQYWSRAWIVQEIMLADNLVVCCGHMSLDWICFTKLVSRLREREDWERSNLSTTSLMLDTAAVSIIDCKASWTALRFERKGAALGHLLHYYQHTECSEIRDRIYGFLGLVDILAPDDVGSSLCVDYSMSIGQVFTEVNRYLQAAHQYSDVKIRLQMVETVCMTLRLSPSELAVESARIDVLSTRNCQRTEDQLLRDIKNENILNESFQCRRQLALEMLLENAELQKTQTFWNPLESSYDEFMSKMSTKNLHHLSWYTDGTLQATERV